MAGDSKMNEDEALQLLKEQIDKIEELKYPPAYHPDYEIWKNTTKKVLKILFGDSYIRMFDDICQGQIAMSDQHHYALFLDVLERKKQLLKGFVKEYERLKTKDISKISSTQLKNVNDIFDSLQVHPRIKTACERLFKDGHYNLSIFESFKALNNFVKEKSERTDLDGKDLMAKVFSKNNPILKLNSLTTDSEINEQEGFMFLFMGSMVGVRNPRAHEEIKESDPYKALEYIAFASLLAKRIDESTKV